MCSKKIVNFKDNKMLKKNNQNFFLLVELSNNIINQMAIKYFSLFKIEKNKQEPNQEIALEHEKKYLQYFNLMNDVSFFQIEEKMSDFIKKHAC